MAVLRNDLVMFRNESNANFERLNAINTNAGIRARNRHRSLELVGHPLQNRLKVVSSCLETSF